MEILTLTPWYRLDTVVRWTGLSMDAFAREIGLKCVEQLYKVKPDNDACNRRPIPAIPMYIVLLICERYPDISSEWLLSGSGEMVDREHKTQMIHLNLTEEQQRSLLDQLLNM